MEYLLLSKGNAMTPQRFWECVIVAKTDYNTIKHYKNLHYTGERQATTYEVERGLGRGTCCLGDIASRFHNEEGVCDTKK